MTGLKLIRMLELLGTSFPVQSPDPQPGLCLWTPLGTFITQPMTVRRRGKGEENTLSAEVYGHHVVICTFGHVSATF